MWRWWRACCDKVPDGRVPLRMNLDETSVCLYQGDRPGTVFASKKRKAPTQKVSRGRRRACLTHVGLICDSIEFQPEMPQFIVGNGSTFLVRDMAALRAACPANVALVKQKSAWNNSSLCTKIVRMLGANLRPFLHRVQPILFLDAVPLHYHISVINACNAWNIWPVVVPARLTWLLQPLDTHFFYKYKVYLKQQYQIARISAATGELTIGEFLGCVYSTIDKIFDGPKLAEAFEENGFGPDLATARKFIRDMLEEEGALQVLAGLPSDEEVAICFPKKAKAPIAAVLRPLRPPQRPPALPRALAGRGVAMLAPARPAAAEASTTRSGSSYGVAAAAARAEQASSSGALPAPPLPRGRRIVFKRPL